MNLNIITGLSGSGKSIALHTLEDLNYYCIDNLPLGLLRALIDEILGEWGRAKKNFAVGIDARSSPEGLTDVPVFLRSLSQRKIQARIIFLHSDEATLLKRFSETRRKHPLSSESCSLLEALALEKKLLEPLATQADFLIDTSRTNIHQLRDLIRERVQSEESPDLSVQFQSFGYKYGVPADADFVFDVRCLPNPHWESHLRQLTGADPQVVAYLEGHDNVLAMRTQLYEFFESWIPHFAQTGRTYLNIAVGCTGGHHRSVYLVNALAADFSRSPFKIIVRHRELV